MRIAVCDEARESRLSITDMLVRLDGNYRVESFQSIPKLLSASAEAPPFDLALLNTHFSDGPGLEAAEKLKQLNRETEIVFVTDDRDQAVEAFALGALHYLIKPLRSKDLQEVFSRMQRKVERGRSLVVRADRALHLLYQDQIAKLEASNHQTRITMMDGTSYMVRKPLQDLAAQLDTFFLLLRRGVIANMLAIQRMGNEDCTLQDGTLITLLRNRKAEIRKKYSDFLIKKLEKPEK